MEIGQEDFRFTALICEKIAGSLFIQGLLTKADLKNPEKVMRLVERVAENPLHGTLDHREDLIKDAGIAWAANKHNTALMFYATFFEHSINYLIISVAAKNLSEKDKKNVVKKLAIFEKFGWILEITNMPKFSATHKATILDISERRNSFVHFKFPVENWEEDDKPEDWPALHKNIKAAVRYMNAYSTRALLGGNGKVIRKITRERFGLSV